MSKRIPGMPEKTTARDISIPVADWWFEAVQREKGDMKNVELLELIEADGGGDVDESELSRVLNRKSSTLYLVVRISDALKIPRPVFLPQTEQEALAIHGALALRIVDQDIDRIRSSLNGDRDEKPPGRSPPATRKHR